MSIAAQNFPDVTDVAEVDSTPLGLWPLKALYLTIPPTELHYSP